MISRAFFRLLPFLCLLMASAKQNDTPSRRLSSLRRLKVKGMNNINVDESAFSPVVEDDWNDRAQMGNRHELRFLKKESDSSTKTKTKSDEESTDGKKGKTKTKTSTTETSSTPPSTTTTVTPVPAPDEPEIAQVIASRTKDNADDDGLLS